MENQKKGNHNPKDNDFNRETSVTNRDNAVVNSQKVDESGTAANRNDQYIAGDTNRITGTTSISDTRNAEIARQSVPKTAYHDDLAYEEETIGSENQFDSENLDDENDDFLKDYGNEKKSFKDSKLGPDFDRN